MIDRHEVIITAAAEELKCCRSIVDRGATRVEQKATTVIAVAAFVAIGNAVMGVERKGWPIGGYRSAWQTLADPRSRREVVREFFTSVESYGDIADWRSPSARPSVR